MLAYCVTAFSFYRYLYMIFPILIYMIFPILIYK